MQSLIAFVPSLLPNEVSTAYVFSRSGNGRAATAGALIPAQAVCFRKLN